MLYKSQNLINGAYSLFHSTVHNSEILQTNEERLTFDLLIVKSRSIIHDTMPFTKLIFIHDSNDKVD